MVVGLNDPTETYRRMQNANRTCHNHSTDTGAALIQGCAWVYGHKQQRPDLARLREVDIMLTVLRSQGLAQGPCQAQKGRALHKQSVRGRQGQSKNTCKACEKLGPRVGCAQVSGRHNGGYIR